MENTTTEIADGDLYPSPLYKQIEIYNHSGNPLLMNPLSDDQQKHSGRVVTHDDDFDTVGLIRLQFETDVFNFLTREFYILGRKVNLSSYFSVNQFQSGIIDIPFICSIKDLDFKIPLRHHESCYITMYSADEGVLSKNTELPQKEIYVFVENTSSKSKTVNLIALAQGINLPLGIKTLSREFNVEGGNDFSLLRVWSKTRQIAEPIYYKYKEGEEDVIKKIHPSSYMSPHQFQGHIIDVQEKFVITPDTEINVNIASWEKVMFHFL